MKKRVKKKHPVFRRILCVAFALIVIAGAIFSHFGGFGTGPCADTDEFEKYAGEVSDITIPQGTEIVALGEASHGNVEFQQLKLDVLQTLVEKSGVRALALEGDFGGCEAVNRYIHGENITAKEAAAAIGFALYRTDEMADLIEWMRNYNDLAAPGEDLQFYGFDMQRVEYNYRYLLEEARALQVDTSELEKIWDEDHYSDDYDSDQIAAVLTAVKEKIATSADNDTAKVIHFADILLQNIELGKMINDGVEGNALRDKLMAENTMWILDQEKARGNKVILISGHNGHTKQFGCYGENQPVMGTILAEKLGDAYFSIGTDFYKTRCNLPKGRDGKRITHTFYSYDPLAKAAKETGHNICWLDFSKLSEDSSLKNQISDYTWMGSLGESYSAIFMNLLPQSYRVWQSPAELYDGMIFVSDAHPTVIHPAE